MTTVDFFPLERWSLWIEMRLGPDARVALVEPVQRADLDDLVAELWWEACARRAAFDHPVEELAIELAALATTPELGAERGCAGLVLEATGPAGPSGRVRVVYSSRCLDPVAVRTLAHWLQREGHGAGTLEELGGARFELCARPSRRGLLVSAPEVSPGVSLAGAAATASPTPAVTPLRRELAPLLVGARSVGEEFSGHPVLYTLAARRRAEEVARRGARRDPPVETGGLLVGHVASCPQSGEAYVVVTDVLPAEEAQGTTFTLSFSSSTWARLAEVRREQPDLAVLGQTHGHNFKPQDVTDNRCASCQETSACRCDTAFLSSDDRTWSRAVFRGQPWQVGHVFGLTADGQPSDAFYGQRGGMLLRRGYHLIGAFEPAPLT